MVEQVEHPLDDIFHALSHGTRREMVSMLAQRPHHISEFVPHFGTTLAAVSKHIKSLERARLIDREVVGRNHICTLNVETMSEAHRWLSEYELFWQNRLDALEKFLAKNKGGRRGNAKKK